MDFTFINPAPRKSTGNSIAIVGAGAAGLCSAGYLATAGNAITIFERLSVAGGLMSYGIPEWRIPQENVQSGVDRLQNEFGVQFEFNTKIIGDNGHCQDIGDAVVKHTRTLEELRTHFTAVLITTGAWGERSLGFEGEHLPGIYSGIDFLYRVRAKHYDASVEHINVQNKKVVVIGAGFTAIDVTIRAIQLGASSVSLIYRKTSKEAPAGLYEITHAIDAGAIWIERHSPLSFIGKDTVEAVRFHDANSDKEVDIACDIVLKAVGDSSVFPETAVSKEIKKTQEVSLMQKERLYMAGDAFTGASKIGKAIQSGIVRSRQILTDLEAGKASSYFVKDTIALQRR